MRRLVGAAWVATIAGWTLCAGAAGVPVDQASADQVRAAQKTFRIADDLYDAKRYEEALTAYRASYDIVASPNSRLMIARCLRELGRIEQAYYELEATIADADQFAKKDEKYRESGRAAREDLDALKKRVALLDLQVVGAPPGTKLSVAGRTIELLSLSRALVLQPGATTVQASAPGRPEQRRELSLEAGSSSRLELDLSAPAAAPKTSPEPAPAPIVSESAQADSSGGSSLRPWAFVAGGVGLAGLATFGIFGALNNSKFSDLEAECGGPCPPDREEDIDAGRRYQTIANVGLVVGVVGLGTGAALFFLSSGPEKSARSRSPWVSVGPGSVELGGRF